MINALNFHSSTFFFTLLIYYIVKVQASDLVGKSNVVSVNRTLEVPSSRIVIIEGIYALSEKLRPLLDLRVSVTGGVHFDLVKRVLRDIQRAGQEPEEIIHQISETVIFLTIFFPRFFVSFYATLTIYFVHF